ncbi:MAG: hypothetical protein A2W26_11955 [Acidobacteria bacterium RBG_16_64_8]|nr:MAG: hypothetical protein A2W26_11955 [Acidobacteria bacterium RBG_16_64_8]
MSAGAGPFRFSTHGAGKLGRRVADWTDGMGLDYRGLLRRYLRSAESILDVGCGTGAGLARLPNLGRIAGVDTFLPYLRGLDKSKYRHALRTVATHLPFRDRSFDAVAAISVLEHLSKEDGYRLVGELERVAQRIVVILTPNGFVPQRMRDGNPTQIHLSGWNPAELRALGYRVHGTGGLRGIRGEGGVPRLRPASTWNAIARASQLLVQRIPLLANEVFCVKTIVPPGATGHSTAELTP